MVLADAVAQYVCKLGEWKISNLELQKLLYIINLLHVGLKGDRLIVEDFEAWDYGPVVRSIYDKCKKFGGDNIWKATFDDVCEGELTDEDKEFIEHYFKQLKDKTPAELIGITHRSNGGWAKNYVPRANIVIPQQDILEEFNKYYRNDQ